MALLMLLIGRAGALWRDNEAICVHGNCRRGNLNEL